MPPTATPLVAFALTTHHSYASPRLQKSQNFTGILKIPLNIVKAKLLKTHEKPGFRSYISLFNSLRIFMNKLHFCHPLLRICSMWKSVSLELHTVIIYLRFLIFLSYSDTALGGSVIHLLPQLPYKLFSNSSSNLRNLLQALVSRGLGLPRDLKMRVRFVRPSVSIHPTS